jgi:hypothetical protein
MTRHAAVFSFRRIAARRVFKFAVAAFVIGAAPAWAEEVLCPEASPYQTFQLGPVTWTHEYSTSFLRRVQIGPASDTTSRIYCEKLHGIVSAEVNGQCRFLPGDGQVQTEAEYGIKVCSMPPQALRRTNIEDCRVICEAPASAGPHQPATAASQ